MAIISILTDAKGHYKGTEVSPGIMEKGWETKVFNSRKGEVLVKSVVRDFMSAITFLSKKEPFITMFSSSIDGYVGKCHDKLTFFKFHYHNSKGFDCEQVVIAPADVKDQYNFCQYLADNEIYDVPEGYKSCWFAEMHESEDRTVVRNELKRNYPIVNGSVVVTINEKKHGFILDYIKIGELVGYLNSVSYRTVNFSRHDGVVGDMFLCVNDNRSNFSFMEQELKFFIGEHLEDKVEKLNNELEFSKKELETIEKNYEGELF